MAQTDASMEYQMFKGLQRPMEFVGLQGRYIAWAAATAGVSVLGFMLMYALSGFLVALIFLASAVCAGAGLIMFKQRQGLYTKKRERGVFVYASQSRL